jgi:type II secretory pathway pseudopilin PulG
MTRSVRLGIRFSSRNHACRSSVELRLIRSSQRGYAYLMALFMVTVMIIATAAAVPNLLTQGRREREEVMIWRGEQYKRAVRLYLQKVGRYPQSLDDLTKQTNGIRFIRQKFKDPMNATDGAWRLIYITAAGQLVGSVRYTSLAQMALAERNGGVVPPVTVPGMPGSPGGVGSGSTTGGESQNTQSSATSPPGTPGDQSGNLPENPDNTGQGRPNQANPSTQPFGSPPGAMMGLSPASQQPQPLSSSGPVFGGSIIGVGSTVEKASLKIYKGGKTYKQWEFIFNPLAQLTLGQPGQVGVPGSAPAGQNPNQQPNLNQQPNPAGTNPENPMPNPMVNPPQQFPPQNQPQ